MQLTRLYLANYRCIATYPVYLSRQQSRLPQPHINLHVNACASEKPQATEAADKKMSLQLGKLFSKDSASIFIHIFLICTVEIRSINSDPLNYTLFSIIFEVIRFAQAFLNLTFLM